MEEELVSMHKNTIWTLVADAENLKSKGCKWIFKTKRDSQGNVERFKARLVIKEFNQREGVDYNETLTAVSIKHYFRVIMTLTAHFNLELHQMDVKIAFLNGELEENIYMKQPLGFIEREKGKLGL